MQRRTKIICTLGPSTDEPKILKEMLLSGMNVARFNFSHGSYDEHEKRFNMLKKVRKELNMPIATMLDTRGPEIRIKTFKNKKVQLTEGEKFTLTTREIEGTEKEVSVTYKKLPLEISVGTSVLIADGLIELVVEKIEKETDIICKIISGGPLSDKKSINIPSLDSKQAFISENDKADIEFGVKTGFDYVAASFSRTVEDVISMNRLLEELGATDISVIAKIENRQGIDNIKEILKEVKGIMIARGDLGVEVPFEEIPAIQKSLIKKTFLSGMPVITATQMLESMMNNPRPTRAEANDVANAIYDGTSAIMLSGETAAGKYPVESVKTMAKIAEITEQDMIKSNRGYKVTESDFGVRNITNAISHATVSTARDINATAIVTVTKTGQTARMISKYRPQVPIIGCTPNQKAYNQLSLVWGVKPLLIKEIDSSRGEEDLLDIAVDEAEKANYISSGDIVVITAGVPLGVSGTTNLIKVHVAGDVLVSGKGICDGIVTATSSVGKDFDTLKKNFYDGNIIVTNFLTKEMISLARTASGIIVEEPGEISNAVIVGQTLDIPVIVGASGATKTIKNGTKITMDALKGTARVEGN